MAVRPNQQMMLDHLRPGAWRTQTTGPNQPTPGVGGNPGRPIDTYQPPTGAPWSGPGLPARVGVDVTTTRKNSLLNSLMSPEALAALGMGGLGFASNMLNSKADAKEGQANRDFTGQQNELDRAARLRELMAAISGDELDDLRARQGAHMDTFAMDPVSQSRDMFSAGLLRDIAGRGAAHVAPGQGITNPFQVSDASMNFLSPDALAENASRFYGAAGSLNPNAQKADLGAMGFGDAGVARQGSMNTTIDAAGQRYTDLNAARRAALTPPSPALSTGPTGPTGRPATGPGSPHPNNPDWVLKADGTGYELAAKKKGGGIGSLLGKIAMMAAPFAMMAVPGLQGPGMGMMLARAGASAGLGAMGTKLQGGSGKQMAANAAYSGAMSAGGDYFNRGSRR